MGKSINLTRKVFNTLHLAIKTKYQNTLLGNNITIPSTKQEYYGFSKIREHSLKIYLSDIANFSVNGKTLYLKNKEYEKGAESINLPSQYCDLYCKYLGYESFFDFLSTTALLSDREKKDQRNIIFSVTKGGLGVGKKVKDVDYYAYYYKCHQNSKDESLKNDNLLDCGYIRLSYTSDDRGIMDMWVDLTDTSSTGEFRIFKDTYISYSLTSNEGDDRIIFGHIFIGISDGRRFANFFIGVSCFISSLSNKCVGVAYLYEKVKNIEEARVKIENIDFRIINYLRQTRIETPKENFQTLSDFPNAVAVKEIKEYFEGVYVEYSVYMPFKHILKSIYKIQSDGIVFCKSIPKDLIGTTQSLNSGNILKMKLYNASRVLAKPENYSSEIVLERKFSNNVMTGTQTSLHDTNSPRAGRVYWKKIDDNYDDLNAEIINFGTRTFFNFLRENPDFQVFIGGEKDDFIDPFYKFSPKYSLTCFYAACYLSQQGKLEKAWNKLKEALFTGFEDIDLLKKEFSKNGALEQLSDKVDIDKLIKQRGKQDGITPFEFD